MLEIITSIASLFNLSSLAQVPLDDLVDKGVNYINTFCLLIAVIGIAYGGYQVTRGSIEQGLLAICGAIIIGASPVIASQIFEFAK